MERSITSKIVVEEISMLSQEQIQDVMDYVHHLMEVDIVKYEDPREYAKVQIRRALKNGFSS